jgi:TolB-like protein
MKNRYSSFLAGVAAAAAVLVMAGPAQAEGKVKVAVRSFSAKGVDASVAGTLETSFCSALANQGLDVLCPEDVKALVTAKQADLGLGNCESDEECVKAIAKVSDAARVVTGEVSKLGDAYLISVSIIDAKNGKVLGRATSEKTNKVEDLLDRVDGLAKKLAAAQ